MIVAAIFRGSAMSVGAAAAFVVTYGFACSTAVAATAVFCAVGSSAALLPSSLCRSSAFVAARSALPAEIHRVC